MKNERKYIKHNKQNKNCFVNYHCSLDCPNIQIDIVDDRYGFGISDDIGLERIKCTECRYNSGKCNDCLFFNSKECIQKNNFKE